MYEQCRNQTDTNKSKRRLKLLESATLFFLHKVKWFSLIFKNATVATMAKIYEEGERTMAVTLHIHKKLRGDNIYTKHKNLA